VVQQLKSKFRVKGELHKYIDQDYEAENEDEARQMFLDEYEMDMDDGWEVDVKELDPTTYRIGFTDKQGERREFDFLAYKRPVDTELTELLEAYSAGEGYKDLTCKVK
jgi:hypothetical protein